MGKVIDAMTQAVTKPYLHAMALLIFTLLVSMMAGDVDATTSDDAFYIDGDGNFTSANGVVSGNGSSDNPYMIKGWEMTCSTTDSIRLENTRAHVVIKDILFNNTTYKGIRIILQNVTNVTLSNITIKQRGSPLELRSCRNVTVKNLTAHHLAWVNIYWSEFIDLFDVDISPTDGRFYLVSSNDTRFINCHTSNSYQAGFRMQSGSRVSIINCTTEGNNAGVSLDILMKDCIVKGCSFMNSTGYEMSIQGTGHTIIQNKFGRHGIFFSPSGNHTIDRTNSMNGVPLQIFYNETGRKIFSNLTQIFLIRCKDILIEDLRFNITTKQIILYEVDNCTIRNVTFERTSICVDAYSCTNLNIRNVTAKLVRAAILLDKCDGSIIEDVLIRSERLISSNYHSKTILCGETTNLTIRNVRVTGDYAAAIVVSNKEVLWGSIRISGVNATVVKGSTHPYLQRGIVVEGGGNVTIADCLIHNFSDNGISAGGWSVLSITCTVLDCDEIGISGFARTLQIRGNYINGTNTGSQSRGIHANGAERCIVDSNAIVKVNRTGISCGWYMKQAYLSNNTLTNCYYAFDLRHNTTAAYNTIRNGRGGFSASGHNITIIYNQMYNVSSGINTNPVRNGTIAHNYINTNGNGIWARWLSNFEIFNNTVVKGYIGIEVEECDNCTIWNNLVEDHSWWGIYSHEGSDNLIFHNTLIRNNYDPDNGKYKGSQARSDEHSDFDSGFAGNWWDDYKEKYPNAKVSNGVWDTPYATSGGLVWDDFPMASLIRDSAAPTAVIIGSDNITIEQGTPLIFNGSLSTDNVGITGYFWTFQYGNQTVNLSGVITQFTFDTPGYYVVTFSVFDAWSNFDTVEIQITVLDAERPVAIAGRDITVDVGAPFELDASASYDNSGHINITWTIDLGGMDIVSHEMIFNLTINVTGRFKAVLNVSDPTDNWATSYLWITVLDLVPPVAVAGDDLTVDQGTLVQFDASDSSDNVAVTFWTWIFQYGGEDQQLYREQASFFFQLAGEYNITLYVQDEWFNTGTDWLIVTVRDIEPPVPRMGEDIKVDEGTMVTFNASASSDNVGIVEYRWAITYQDVDHIRYGKKVEFTFPTPGIYLVILQVTDDAGNSNGASIIVTVLDITSPLAIFQLPSEVDQGAEVTLDGSGSSDNVGISSYSWTIIGEEEHVELEGVSALYTFDVPGEYEVTLTVLDAVGHEASLTLDMKVLDIFVPVAIVPEDMVLWEGESATLDGSGSHDNVGITDQYWTLELGDEEWTQNGAVVQFKFEQPGDYVATLFLLDADGNVGLDIVNITVLPGTVGWALGPFLDEDGQPVIEVNVSVHVADVIYTGTTDTTGHVELEIYNVNLPGRAGVKAEKDGWNTLEFDLDIDEDGMPVGEIPLMVENTGPSEPDDPDGEDEPPPGLSEQELAMIIGVAVIAVTAIAVWLVFRTKRA